MQKGSKLSEYLGSLLKIYSRGPLVFLFYNPSFYITIFAIISFNQFGIAAFLLFTCKLFDLILKIMLLDRITNNKPLGFFTAMLQEDTHIGNALKICVSCFYVVLFYIAFV
ncbi:MAG: hypothetical protein ACK5LP_04720 [Campylobacteraceae bacterium]